MPPIRVLLADDEKRFILNLAQLMNHRGFRVSTAFDGQQALDHLAGAPDHDVVVLDLHMPGMDGLETLQRIKSSFPDTEVIMLTGQATLEDGVQALRLGAFDYLQKPCDIEELEDRIAAACSVEQIKRHPVLWPRTTAGELLLTGFAPLRADDSLERALAIFNRYRPGEGARLLFVTDEQSRLVGRVSRQDLLHAAQISQPQHKMNWKLLNAHPEILFPMKVKQIMVSGVETVAPQTDLAETAQRMLSRWYDSIPVVDQGNLLGIVRLRDVLQHVPSDEAEGMRHNPWQEGV